MRPTWRVFAASLAYELCRAVSTSTLHSISAKRCGHTTGSMDPSNSPSQSQGFRPFRSIVSTTPRRASSMLDTPMVDKDSQMASGPSYGEFIPNSQSYTCWLLQEEPLHDEVVLDSQLPTATMFPFGSTFHSMMHPVLFKSPPSMTATATIDPLLQVYTSPSNAHPCGHAMSIGPAIPVMQPSPTARSAHVQLPSSSVATSPPCAATAETPTEKKLKSNEIWAASIINVLLDLYEDGWITINRGNFKAKHWVEVARDLNARCGTEFAETQCKYKWKI
ncbi:hypothetical protein L7F22_032778 [Adiantum nelumboides]|nr:hypothetical protein [Adiantum nelumboides]